LHENFWGNGRLSPNNAPQRRGPKNENGTKLARKCWAGTKYNSKKPRRK